MIITCTQNTINAWTEYHGISLKKKKKKKKKKKNKLLVLPAMHFSIETRSQKEGTQKTETTMHAIFIYIYEYT
jgi:hypothetical protein